MYLSHIFYKINTFSLLLNAYEQRTRLSYTYKLKDVHVKFFRTYFLILSYKRCAIGYLCSENGMKEKLYLNLLLPIPWCVIGTSVPCNVISSCWRKDTTRIFRSDASPRTSVFISPILRFFFSYGGCRVSLTWPQTFWQVLLNMNYTNKLKFFLQKKAHPLTHLTWFLVLRNHVDDSCR